MSRTGKIVLAIALLVGGGVLWYRPLFRGDPTAGEGADADPLAAAGVAPAPLLFAGGAGVSAPERADDEIAASRLLLGNLDPRWRARRRAELAAELVRRDDPFRKTAAPDGPDSETASGDAPAGTADRQESARPLSIDVRAILVSGERRCALVDGRIVEVGERVAGGRAVVTSIDAGGIEVECGERRFQFSIDRGRAPGSGRTPPGPVPEDLP